MYVCVCVCVCVIHFPVTPPLTHNWAELRCHVTTTTSAVDPLPSPADAQSTAFRKSLVLTFLEETKTDLVHQPEHAAVITEAATVMTLLMHDKSLDRNTATEVSARLLELANPSHRDPGEDDFVGAALQAFSAMPTFFVEEHVSEFLHVLDGNLQSADFARTYFALKFLALLVRKSPQLLHGHHTLIHASTLSAALALLCDIASPETIKRINEQLPCVLEETWSETCRNPATFLELFRPRYIEAQRNRDGNRAGTEHSRDSSDLASQILRSLDEIMYPTVRMGIWKYLCVLFVACFERKSQNLFLNIAKSCFQADKVRPRRKHRAGGSSSSHGDVHVNPHSVVRWAFQAWRGMVLAIFKHQSPLKKRHLDLLLQPIVSRFAVLCKTKGPGICSQDQQRVIKALLNVWCLIIQEMDEGLMKEGFVSTLQVPLAWIRTEGSADTVSDALECHIAPMLKSLGSRLRRAVVSDTGRVPPNFFSQLVLPALVETFLNCPMENPQFMSLSDASLLALVSVWKSLLVLATDMLPPPPESFNPEDMAMCLQLTHYLSDIATSLAAGPMNPHDGVKLWCALLVETMSALPVQNPLLGTPLGESLAPEFIPFDALLVFTWLRGLEHSSWSGCWTSHGSAKQTLAIMLAECMKNPSHKWKAVASFCRVATSDETWLSQDGAFYLWDSLCCRLPLEETSVGEEGLPPHLLREMLLWPIRVAVGVSETRDRVSLLRKFTPKLCRLFSAATPELVEEFHVLWVELAVLMQGVIQYSERTSILGSTSPRSVLYKALQRRTLSPSTVLEHLVVSASCHLETAVSGMVVHIVQGLLQVLHGDLYVESSSLHGSLTAGVGAEFQVSHPLLLDVAIVLRSLLQALPSESSATYTVAKQIFKCCQRAFQIPSSSLLDVLGLVLILRTPLETLTRDTFLQGLVSSLATVIYRQFLQLLPPGESFQEYHLSILEPLLRCPHLASETVAFWELFSSQLSPTVTVPEPLQQDINSWKTKQRAMLRTSSLQDLLSPIEEISPSSAPILRQERRSRMQQPLEVLPMPRIPGSGVDSNIHRLAFLMDEDEEPVLGRGGKPAAAHVASKRLADPEDSNVVRSAIDYDASDSQFADFSPDGAPPPKKRILTDRQREKQREQRHSAITTYTTLDPSGSQESLDSQSTLLSPAADHPVSKTPFPTAAAASSRDSSSGGVVAQAQQKMQAPSDPVGAGSSVFRGQSIQGGTSSETVFEQAKETLARVANMAGNMSPSDLAALAAQVAAANAVLAQELQKRSSK